MIKYESTTNLESCLLVCEFPVFDDQIELVDGPSFTRLLLSLTLSGVKNNSILSC